ncbi:MAG: hypothetical protein LBT39_09075 [Treponema sp.]|jgi:starvation-inducible outer membrane lipoprotein|nr:hypothetical protein [Treponema sp.]
MKKCLLLLAVLAVLMLTACKTVSYNIVAVTENPVGTKVGQIDRTKGGVLEAARNGGITRISTVSYQYTDTWIFIPNYVISRKYEIVVTGE